MPCIERCSVRLSARARARFGLDALALGADGLRVGIRLGRQFTEQPATADEAAGAPADAAPAMLTPAAGPRGGRPRRRQRPAPAPTFGVTGAPADAVGGRFELQTRSGILRPARSALRPAARPALRRRR